MPPGSAGLLADELERGELTPAGVAGVGGLAGEAAVASLASPFFLTLLGFLARAEARGVLEPPPPEGDAFLPLRGVPPLFPLVGGGEAGDDMKRLPPPSRSAGVTAGFFLLVFFFWPALPSEL